MEVLMLCIGVVVGGALGYIMSVAAAKRKFVAKVMGWLRIDHSEPDEPARMFVELRSITPDMIAKEQFVMFEVIDGSYISHD